MTVIRFRDYCCQGGARSIQSNDFSLDDLVIVRRGQRVLRFSPLGNRPAQPRLALVGITPGGQSERFASLLRTLPVAEAAKRAAFHGAQEAIKRLLAANGFAKYANLDLTGDLNDNRHILTTSVVKCCLMVEGSYKYKAPEINSIREAKYCASTRFVQDIERYSSLRWVIIFGGAGWDALNLVRVDGTTVIDRLRTKGITVLNFPHFAQNFHQRAIFCLAPHQDASYLKDHPLARPYAPAAVQMRARVLDAVARRV